MNSINSISKGIFKFTNGKDIKQLKNKKKIKKSVISEECNQLYYVHFQEKWNEIEKKIEKIQSESYERTLTNLLEYINAANTDNSNLQTAVLLTGVNQPDHFKQFDLLSQKISNNCYSIITILKSRDSPNIKTAIETLVAGFIYNKLDASDDDENMHVKLKKKQQTLAVLEAWYNNNYGNAKRKPKLVIMLADFDQFPPQVVQDLIGILCSYTSRLPLVMIIGIATAFKTLHNVLPFHITNKIAVNVFQSESSSSMLNRILDEVILNHNCPFYLSGKSFKILLDIFLFYDYSLMGFIQGFKVFMLEQSLTKKWFNTVYSKNLTGDVGAFKRMTHEECEWLRRHCMSFRTYVEEHEKDPQMQIDLIKNDKFFADFTKRKITRGYKFFFHFFCCLRMLAVLIEDLPRNNLGKQLRELYPVCSETNILKLEEFQECFKLLRFSSKDKFLLKLDKVIKIVSDYVNDTNIDPKVRTTISDVFKTLQNHREKISNAGMSPIKENNSTPLKSSNIEIIKKVGNVTSRHEMLQKLKESASKPSKVIIEYEKHLYECIDYIYDVFKTHLCPFNKGPVLHELFVISDCSSVRRYIVGSPRGSLHNALVNPYHYLQCKCCALKDNEQIVSTMPDISIAYKLHLECNKFINLFDWLQSFSMVIDSNEDEDENISSEVQAKFTRSVAELQFLGFIKQAKQKTDHVMRLTW